MRVVMDGRPRDQWILIGLKHNLERQGFYYTDVRLDHQLIPAIIAYDSDEVGSPVHTLGASLDQRIHNDKNFTRDESEEPPRFKERITSAEQAIQYARAYLESHGWKLEYAQGKIAPTTQSENVIHG